MGASTVVHYLNGGVAPCGTLGATLPKDWPPDHKWSPMIKDLTCEGCRVALGMPPGHGTLISGPERLAVKLADRKYAVKIFEADSPSGLEGQMISWFNNLSANQEVVKFFEVGGSVAAASNFPTKLQISSDQSGNYGAIETREKWVVGILYVTQQ